jgi:hypothetical protein
MTYEGPKCPILDKIYFQNLIASFQNWFSCSRADLCPKRVLLGQTRIPARVTGASLLLFSTGLYVSPSGIHSAGGVFEMYTASISLVMSESVILQPTEQLVLPVASQQCISLEMYARSISLVMSDNANLPSGERLALPGMPPVQKPIQPSHASPIRLPQTNKRKRAHR